MVPHNLNTDADIFEGATYFNPSSPRSTALIKLNVGFREHKLC